MVCKVCGTEGGKYGGGKERKEDEHVGGKRRCQKKRSTNMLGSETKQRGLRAAEGKRIRSGVKKSGKRRWHRLKFDEKFLTLFNKFMPLDSSATTKKTNTPYAGGVYSSSPEFTFADERGDDVFFASLTLVGLFNEK